MLKKYFKKYFIQTLFLNAPFVIKTMSALITLPIILANLSIVNYGKWQFIVALQVWLNAITAVNITRSSKRGIARSLNGTFLYGFLARLKLIVPIHKFRPLEIIDII